MFKPHTWFMKIRIIGHNSIALKLMTSILKNLDVSHTRISVLLGRIHHAKGLT